jgi:alkanesulfonate monooxygenase SsuD/methylene tetrahydromethanopterin reductase-like flavin-dependent oxidoreductase (luciferase family)
MKRPIRFGVYLPQVGFSFDEIRERVLACEALGFHSVWFMDHLHPPGMPKLGSFEAWTLASALAPLTSRIRIGHLVLANSFRHPALLAKMASSLDVVSGGRLELGIGSGSYAPEHRMYGIGYEAPAVRARKLGEALEIVRRLFDEDEVTFDGEFYRLEAAVNVPKPLQHGGPPLWVGGAGEKTTLPLAARWGSGWNCPTYALGRLDAKRRALEAECARIDRDPREVRVSLESVLVIGRDESAVTSALAVAEKRYPGPGWGLHDGGFVGTPPRIVARIREIATLGIDTFVFFFSDRASPATLELFAREVLPACGEREP